MVPRLFGAHRADRHGHAGLALQRAEQQRIVARRGEQQLQIRTGQSLARAGEHLRRGHAEGQRAVADQEEPRDLARQPHAARELVDRDVPPHPVRNPRDVVVLQVGTDAGQVVHHVHADRLQMLRRSDAGNLQQMRRIHRAAAQDHLASPRGPRDRRHAGGTPRRRSVCPRTAAASPAHRFPRAGSAAPSRRPGRSARWSRETGRCASSANSRRLPARARSGPCCRRSRPRCAASTKRCVSGRMVR